MLLRTIQDLEAIEHVPGASRLTVHSTYELIREAARKIQSARPSPSSQEGID